MITRMDQQSPYETTFKITRFAQTNKNQSPKLAIFPLNIQALFFEKAMKMFKNSLHSRMDHSVHLG